MAVEHRKRILVVEDEPDLNRMMCDFLATRGYVCTGAFAGDEAISRFFEEPPDLVVLDVMLPNIDGLNVLRTIRRTADTPVIMVTARGAEEDKLSGFDTGVDDYVVKPVQLKELAARIAAVLRRTGSAPATDMTVITLGGLTVDQSRRRVLRDGQPVQLTDAQFRILATLASDPGRVFTRMQLLESVQGDSFAAYERTVDAHVKNIRKRIETDPSRPRYIETVRGVGYRFCEGPWT